MKEKLVHKCKELMKKKYRSVGTMLNILLKEERKLNTITKYPSILTYHKLGNRGTLVEDLTEYKCIDDKILEATEKVDGTNVRIIICGNDYIIGTREEFIYAKGDRIRNDKQSILFKCIDIAERLIRDNKFKDTELIVIYGENYGKDIGRGYKNYANKEVAFRVFDMWSMEVSKVQEIINMDLNKISTWRENGGQPYFSIDKLKNYCTELQLEKTPVLFSLKHAEMPITVADVYNMLIKYKNTKVSLDVNSGKSEGIVIRSKYRSYIKKLRFEDYEKTLKIK